MNANDTINGTLDKIMPIEPMPEDCDSKTITELIKDHQEAMKEAFHTSEFRRMT